MFSLLILREKRIRITAGYSSNLNKLLAAYKKRPSLVGKSGLFSLPGNYLRRYFLICRLTGDTAKVIPDR